MTPNLRELAEEAKDESYPPVMARPLFCSVEVLRYVEAATPSAIIALLDENERLEKLDWVEALKIAEDVFNQYKINQPKWWKRMDGTPILNDISVLMAEAYLKGFKGRNNGN